MRFYHVSFDMEEKENPYLFIPRIPTFKAASEDVITPRISLSTSVENCIQAISPANRESSCVDFINAVRYFESIDRTEINE